MKHAYKFDFRRTHSKVKWFVTILWLSVSYTCLFHEGCLEMGFLFFKKWHFQCMRKVLDCKTYLLGHFPSGRRARLCFADSRSGCRVKAFRLQVSWPLHCQHLQQASQFLQNKLKTQCFEKSKHSNGRIFCRSLFTGNSAKLSKKVTLFFLK